MFKLISGLICFLLMKEGFCCIPTKPNDGHYIMIPATDVCVNPPWTVQFFVGNGVVLGAGNNPRLGMKASIGQCEINFPRGAVKYYDRRTLADWFTPNSINKAIGFWDRSNCPNACVCTLDACYELVSQDPIEPMAPQLYFYPHCNGVMDCFVAVVFDSDGLLVNPENPTDIYESTDQGPPNVNDLSYPKSTRVGCSGCPVLK